jgi:hypothetical protein
MPTILDVFNSNAYSTQSMTTAMNLIPTQYGLINQMGLFKDKGITTTSVAVEKKQGKLVILSQTQRGGPALENTKSKREMVSLMIPNFSLHDKILADDVQGVRKFGTETETETVQEKVTESLANMKANHEITLEYMRMGALQGQVVDGDGNTVVNLLTTFNIRQHTQHFQVSQSSTEIGGVLRNVKRYTEQHLQGETMTSLLCLCSGSFFEALVKHSSIKEAYHAYQGASPYRDDQRYDFVFQGIHFKEYEGFATNAAGSTVRFIPDGKAIFLPLGTRNAFETVYAPADYIETVNTMGQPFYAKQHEDDFGKGIEIETQTNPLPINKRPDLITIADLT